MNRKKHRIIAALTTTMLMAVILLSGTFAWRNMNQTAKNETIRTINPGGRLHDDFNGTNKDVYVENFFTVNEGGLPIFARIRLDEYMEIGADAGQKRNDPARQAVSLVAGADINNVNSWTTHIPDQDAPQSCSAGPFHEYWKWTMGGETVYMPTFNKNKDSLKADINGTWEGIVVGDSVHYDDYQTYTNGQTVSGDAVYDDDANDVEDNNTYTISESHTAKPTQNAIVLTMKQWKAMGSPVGRYWVYDEDGWAYWAEPILPGEATGLLLDEIRLTGDLSEDCYYSINVVAQFATKDDWGSVENPVGFFDTTKGSTPSSDAMFLLNQAAGREFSVTVTTVGGFKNVQKGESLGFSHIVTCMEQKVSDQNVTWSVTGASSKDTVIDADGVLTVGADEVEETILQIKATTKNGTFGTTQVKVINP